jgi:MYND finger/Sel1 repeat
MDDLHKRMAEISSSLTKLLFELDKLYPRGCAKVENRHERLMRLEQAYLELAAVEEQIRVESVKQRAVASGLVVTLAATEEVGECPLCLDEIPSKYSPTGQRYYRVNWCCGAKMCVMCSDDTERRCKMVTERLLRTDPSSANVGRVCQQLSDLEIAQRCPFCRATYGSDEKEISLLRKHASAGKSWAQHELGAVLMNGIYGVTIDRWEAAKSFELAAAQGFLYSMVDLYSLWTKGFPEIGVSPAKAKKYLLNAARLGYGTAQHEYGVALGSDPGAMDWFTLAAAQGYAESRIQLGDMFCMNEESDHDKSYLFKAIYWYQQAAFQGETGANVRLAPCLVEARATCMDGQFDLVGYSAVPEACFWYSLATDHVKRQGHEVVELEYLQVVKCGCCGKRNGRRVQIKRCAKCKAVGYCSRDCQSHHWKMGHKRDCNGVEELRKRLKASTDYFFNVKYYGKD